MDTIVDWIYSADKYAALKEKETKKGKSEATAHASVQRRARDKFRKLPAILFGTRAIWRIIIISFYKKRTKAVPY